MSKQEEFENSTLYEAVNEFLKNPEKEHEDMMLETENSHLEEASSLDEFEVEKEDDDTLRYVYPTEEDDNSYLYFLLRYDESGKIERAKLDVGTIAGPLAGHGYSWFFNTDGTIDSESPWIS